MSRLASALAGISIAVVAVAPALAASVSNRLTVTVTVVAPGTLGGTNLPAGPGSAPEDKAEQPAADAPSPPGSDGSQPAR